MQILGDYIREKRKQKGLTQVKLSAIVEINETTISRIEKGERKILPHQIKKIAKALEINEHEFNETYIADRIFSEYGDNPKVLNTLMKAIDIIKDRKK
jgi:transcriptional regulator with XRE-family HTH domain